MPIQLRYIYRRPILAPAGSSSKYIDVVLFVMKTFIIFHQSPFTVHQTVLEEQNMISLTEKYTATYNMLKYHALSVLLPFACPNSGSHYGIILPRLLQQR